MHRQRDNLIPAAEAEAGRDERQTVDMQPGRGGAWKRRKFDSKCTTSSKFMTRHLAKSRLLKKFSEFSATRNTVISGSSEESSSCCYDKLVSQPDDLSLASSVIFQNSHNNSNNLREKISATHKHSSKNQEETLTARSKRPINQRRRNGSQQQRTASLLGALLSPNSKSSKRSLLVELLKAPTFLAALFSLVLAVTLFVLYALSFGAHPALTSRRGNLSSSSSPLSPLSSSSSSSSAAAAAASRAHAIENLAIGGGHRISSRDLAPESAGEQSPADDEDDEGEEKEKEDVDETDEEERGLPEGLGRALGVQTECGLLMGSPEDDGVVFRGIPYASPPIGRRRWRRPRPIWLDPELCNSTFGPAAAPLAGDESNVRDGDGEESMSSNKTRDEARRERKRRRERRRRGAKHCAQLNPITNRFNGQEDCLYLDVYLPRLDQTKRLPVMVYIHGGFLSFGSSSGQLSWMKARPSGRLATELDVIVVAFNYRLQALGFMTLPQSSSLSSEASNGSHSLGGEQAGNFGLWDQLTALNWIKRNIESFGGDPDNIVLFGPDSASSLVWALLGNRQQAAAQPPNSGIKLRNLFRAAWLTNPTIFYDLPYELASQHYQRLFQNQLTCLLERPGRNETSTQNSLAPGDLTAAAAAATTTTTTAASMKHHDNLKDCLMQLSAEQVMRHYLGNDHPSYRLDDQNSLPIHGIFVDQFVTVDGELVRDASLFSAAALGPTSAESKAPGCNATASSETNLPKSSSRSEPHINNNRNNHNNSSGSASGESSHYSEGFGAEIRETNEMAAARRDYNGDAARTKASDCAAAASSSSKRDNPEQSLDRRGSRNLFDDQNTIDLLIGSTAQAAEHWPCPRNLHQWTWDDFKRYVATSLNSFATDLYRRASGLYFIPKSRGRTNNDKQQASASPAWTYLTMVSDIRQICPINELVDNLRIAEKQNGLVSVRRYMVESSPMEPPAVSTIEDAASTNNDGHGGASSSGTNDHYANSDHRPSGRPKFAYHTKDLAAFFGYEFDPTFRPQQRDLKFQREVRRMVKQFVHKPSSHSASIEAGQSKLIAVLDQNGATRYVDKYRETECSMWRRHLGKLYAWLS